MPVELKTLPPTRVAYMRHTGPYGDAGIGRVWQRFATWCADHGLMQPRRTMYGISQDDPSATPADLCRYDCCIEVDDDFKPEGEVGVQNLQGGRYACTRFVGTNADIHAAWERMFGVTLPQSGCEPEDAPALEMYDQDFAMDEKTGAFKCWLCVPVKAS